MAELKKLQQAPLTVKSDCLPGDMQTEIVDSIIACIDKFGCSETAAKSVKESLDKSYGPTWQVIIGIWLNFFLVPTVVGKGFAFDVTSLNHTLVHCYYQGDTGILVYKS